MIVFFTHNIMKQLGHHIDTSYLCNKVIVVSNYKVAHEETNKLRGRSFFLEL